MPRVHALLATVALLSALPAAAQTGDTFVPVTDKMLERPDPGDWLMWRRTQNGWAYSPLEQINKRNVATLKQVWTAPMDTGNQEATPIVYGGMMYVPNRGDHVVALDAKSGTPVWEYQRVLPEGVNGGTNRAIAIWGTTLIDAGSDNMLYAIDARTGKLVWETKIHDPTTRARATSGPLIAKGRVITGRQCQPDATHEACVVTAHDAATGRELWRARTIPRPGEPGDESWGNVPMEQRWHVGTWMVPSFDPTLDLIYIGTSVTIPAAKFQLGGTDKQHLYHNSTLALDLETGKMKWYYQHLVDHWDLDHPFERLLVDTRVAPDAADVAWMNPKIRPGERRKVVTGIPGKTGVVYTLDRETGEFLWARPTVFQNVIKSIDGNGRVTDDPERVYTRKDQTILVCPGMNGGKNWPAGAYSPKTNTMYMPMQNQCMTARTEDDQRDPKLVYGLEQKQELSPGTTNQGAIYAVSAGTGKTMWRHEQRAGVMSMVTTGGGLVFGGDVAGKFTAYDDETGAVLWQADLGSPISGFPVVYAVDGKEYVAVSTSPSNVFGNLTRLVPDAAPKGIENKMFVFALP
jgi:PQQ-dependent dehydrogenase (methanol/ethanol family)